MLLKYLKKSAGLAAIISLFHFCGCSTIKSENSRSGKDALILWIIKNADDNVVESQLLSFKDISDLKLTLKVPDFNDDHGIDILSSPLSFKDSLSLKKELISQRSKLSLKLPKEKEYRHSFSKDKVVEEAYIELSDPIYFKKENLYIVHYNHYCGHVCGQRDIRVYRQTLEGFEEIKVLITGTS